MTDNNYWQNGEIKYPVDLPQNGSTPVYSQQFGLDGSKYAQQGPKKTKKGVGAGIIAICAVLSLLCGFGGSYLGYRLFGSSAPAEQESTPGGFVTAGEHNAVTTSIESLSDLVASTEDSVVEITTEKMTTSSIFGQYITEGAGSGVIIRADGYIATNNHVTSGASNITVKMNDGTTYPAQLVGSDSKTDLAVIKIEATGLNAAVMGESADVSVGDRVIAIGNPLGSLGGTVTDGIISALNREIQVNGQTMTLLQTNAAVNPGNSGGGLFNAYGELVGIVNAKPSSTAATTSIDGLAFAIPVDTVKQVAGSIIDSGYVTGRVVMGISVLEITDEQTAWQYKVDRYGVYIVSITEGGGADRAGLEVGDCIISVNEQVVETANDITSQLDEAEIGDKVSVQIIRDGRTSTYEVELGEYVPEEQAAA